MEWVGLMQVSEKEEVFGVIENGSPSFERKLFINHMIIAKESRLFLWGGRQRRHGRFFKAFICKSLQMNGDPIGFMK
jgi:hypothetical protein